MAESQKARIMRILNISPEEADDVLAYDQAVERGKPTRTDKDNPPVSAG